MRTTLLFLAFALLNLQVLFSQESKSIEIAEKGNLTEVEVYPNPAKDIIYIDSVKNIEFVRFYNKKGDVVFQASPNNNQVELTGLQSGFYLMCAYANGKKLKKRIIKKV